ncbi:MAG: hypothetical protein Q7S09_02790 [bacterium]|nr:hypothetical protein [bacterium]
MENEHRAFLEKLIRSGLIALIVAVLCFGIYAFKFFVDASSIRDRNDFYKELVAPTAQTKNSDAYNVAAILRTLPQEISANELALILDKSLVHETTAYGKIVREETQTVIAVMRGRLPYEKAFRAEPSWDSYWKNVDWWLLWIFYPLFSLIVVLAYIFDDGPEPDVLKKPWPYAWGLVLFPGTIGAIIVFAVIIGAGWTWGHVEGWFVNFRRTFRHVLANGRILSIPEVEPVPPLQDLPRPRWLANSKKPETILETSSLARTDTKRREKIISSDARVSQLRARRDAIREQWIRILGWYDIDLQKMLAANRVQEARRTTVSLEENIRSVRGDLQSLGTKLAGAQRNEAVAQRDQEELEKLPPKPDPEKLSRFEEAFRLLEDFPDVMAINVEGECISVFTDTLYIMYDSRLFEIGNFRIDFIRNVGEGFGIYIRNLAKGDGEVDYPYGSDGGFCFGNLTGDINNLLAERDIPSAVVHILKSITHLNKNDKNKLRDFKEVPWKLNPAKG